MRAKPRSPRPVYHMNSLCNQNIEDKSQNTTGSWFLQFVAEKWGQDAQDV